MDKYNVIMPLSQGNSDHELVGIASSLSIDRDCERMSIRALKSIVNDINRHGLNIFQDHDHSVFSTIGVTKEAQLTADNEVQVKIRLDDSSTNPKVPMLLGKLKKGIKLGLSIGGLVRKFDYVYEKTLGKRIRVLDDVSAYEISLVGIPSCPDAYVSLGSAIAKSAKLGRRCILTDCIQKSPMQLYSPQPSKPDCLAQKNPPQRHY